MLRNKSPLIAGILNFIVPGSGLLYIGRKRDALINFLLVNVTLLILTVVVAEPTLMEHVHWLFLGLAALSAGYAHGAAVSQQRADAELAQDDANSPQSAGTR